MGHHRDIYDAANKAWAIGDLEGSLAMYSPDAVLIDPTGEYHGLQAIREHTAEAFVGFSSIENETTNLLECGDSYVAEWRIRMTHSGAIRNPDGTKIPPTGRTIEFSGCEVGRLDGDHVIYLHGYWDNMAMAVQLGLIPTAE